MNSSNLETATLGGGCFWCVEAVFQRVFGVIEVLPGYSGGSLKDPDYESVCTGKTGHAEVCQILFDNTRISYHEILEIFWMTHDPTTKDRQGNDAGPQYRSVVFYHNEDQKKIALELKDELEKSGVFKSPVITEISEFNSFYVAEKYHHNYFNNHPGEGYCSFVIRPKLEKFTKTFSTKIIR